MQCNVCKCTQRKTGPIALTSSAGSPTLDFFGTTDDVTAATQKQGKKRAATQESLEDIPDAAECPLDTQEQVLTFRKRMGIRVFGTDVPKPIASFTQLHDRYKMRNFLRRNLRSMEFATPTPIQMQAMTIMLEVGVSFTLLPA
jgi:ATP-dependent RNA helicase DDX52/ROK1